MRCIRIMAIYLLFQLSNFCKRTADLSLYLGAQVSVVACLQVIGLEIMWQIGSF
jgi:hypothetical protein